MEEKLKTLMAEIFNLPRDSIQDSLSIHDSNLWDSLKHMELIVGIEEVFEIELTSDDIVQMQSVALIKKILHNKISD